MAKVQKYVFEKLLLTMLVFAFIAIIASNKASAFCFADETNSCEYSPSEYIGTNNCFGECTGTCTTGPGCCNAPVGTSGPWVATSNCACSNSGGSCSGNGDCCNSLVCQGGTCITYTPPCGDLGDICCSGNTCNGGLTCCGGTCEASCCSGCGPGCVDSYGPWGPDYCAGDEVRHDRTFFDKTCNCNSCQTTTSTETATVQNCNSQDAWVDTGSFQWVDNGNCSQKQQKQQRFYDGTCQSSSCTSIPTSNYRWVDTGATQAKPAGTVCRASAGACDAVETCNGVSQACPADAYLPAGSVCGDPTNTACNPADTCTGTSPICNTAFAPLGTNCNPTLSCSNPGDNGYGTGTYALCTGSCDGTGSCDYAENAECQNPDTVPASCTSCGSRTWFGAYTGGVNQYCCGDDGAADNFYYNSGSATGSVSIVCDRCSAGSRLGPVNLYGNGYLNDSINICFYGDIYCNVTAATSGTSEVCNDACVNDNDGGDCNLNHNPAAKGGETCYYNERCTDTTGCGYNSNGLLRIEYCDACTDTGVVPGDYCPAPGTWTGNTCYYGSQFCTGTTCGMTQGLTACPANNASCCSLSDGMIWTGVGCSVAGPVGTYQDRDDAQTYCEGATGLNCNPLTWSNGYENQPFGNYTDKTTTECCGDDISEYYVSAGIGPNGCCDAPTDCVDRTGTCRIGHETDPSLCSNGVDDDCDGLVDGDDGDCYGTVNGTVFDGDNLAYGWVIQGATVKGTPPNLPSSYESSNTSNVQGYFRLNKVFVGTYNFVARKEGYVDDIKKITVLSNMNVQQDFFLYTGINCNADCTDQNGYCNTACNGLVFNTSGGPQSCNFASQACAGKPRDYKISYINKSNDYYTEVTCCEGPTNSYPALKATVSGAVDSLYDHVVPVKISGRTYLMHILVWNPK